MNHIWKNFWTLWSTGRSAEKERSQPQTQPQSTELSKTTINEEKIKELEEKLAMLEVSQSLVLNTVAVLTNQTKNVSLITEALSASQLTQQGQLSNAAEMIDQIIQVLGLVEHVQETNEDESWN